MYIIIGALLLVSIALGIAAIVTHNNKSASWLALVAAVMFVSAIVTGMAADIYTTGMIRSGQVAEQICTPERTTGPTIIGKIIIPEHTVEAECVLTIQQGGLTNQITIAPGEASKYPVGANYP